MPRYIREVGTTHIIPLLPDKSTRDKFKKMHNWIYNSRATV